MRALAARPLIAGAFLIVSLALPSALRAGDQGTLTQELGDLADGIARYLKDRHIEANGKLGPVDLGQFQTPANTTAGGNVVKTCLEEQLRLPARNIAVESTAKLHIQGSIKLNPGRGGAGLPQAQVTVEMVDDLNQPIPQFTQFLQENPFNLVPVKINAQLDVQKVMPSTVATPPAASDAAPQTTATKPTAPKPAPPAVEAVNASFRDPQVDVHGPKIAAEANGLYVIEMCLGDAKGAFSPAAGRVQVIDNGTKFDSGTHSGNAFFQVERGEIYGFRIYNRTADDVGACIQIDGLSLFTFCKNEEYRQLDRLVIRAGSSAFIGGWFIDTKNCAPFTVGLPTESAARIRDSNAAGVGTIGVQFYACWKDEANRPSFERAQQGAEAPLTGLEAGTLPPGEKVLAQTYVEERWNFGKTFLGSISVRYQRPKHPNDLPPENGVK